MSKESKGRDRDVIKYTIGGLVGIFAESLGLSSTAVDFVVGLLELF